MENIADESSGAGSLLELLGDGDVIDNVHLIRNDSIADGRHAVDSDKIHIKNDILKRLEKKVNGGNARERGTSTRWLRRMSSSMRAPSSVIALLERSNDVNEVFEYIALHRKYKKRRI